MSNSAKIRVGEAAVQFVTAGMRLGIGTGSTAEAFVHALSKAVANGLDIVGVPTSIRTQKMCEELGIPLTDLSHTPELDLTIDGADEIDPQLNLIKGGGGALLREKIVACASAEMLVIADDSKLVDVLGKYPLPIEVNAFGFEATEVALNKLVNNIGLKADCQRRLTDDGALYTTDGGHHIVDASFGRIPDAQALADQLNQIPGVVEHGLFTGIASRAIVASDSGIDIIEQNT